MHMNEQTFADRTRYDIPWPKCCRLWKKSSGYAIIWGHLYNCSYWMYLASSCTGSHKAGDKL